jgi:biopolymer transport protein ExbD
MQFRPRQRRNVYVNIVSLVDVVFLLIIFFTVTATFMDQPAIKLDLPTASADPPKENQADIMTVYLSKEGDIYFEDKPVRLDDLPGLLKAGLEKGRQNRLMLMADREVIHGRVIEVMDLAKQNGIQMVTVATQKPDSGKKR